MSIDINILCIKQSESEIEYNKDIFLLEKLNKYPTDDVIYKDNWFLYNAIIGSGYNLYSNKIPDSTFDIVDFQEKNDVDSYMKYMIQDQRLPQNSDLEIVHDCVLFSEAYFNEFEKLLKEFIKKSKIKTCIVLFRLQVSCPERYVGRISLKQFISMLREKEIYLNTGYIISEQDYD